MSNNLAGLLTKLDTALGDPSDKTWSSTEKSDLITQSVAQMWPRVKRILDPTVTTIETDAGTYYYDLPEDVLAVSRVDWVDADGNSLGTLPGGTWEVTGDPQLGTGMLHVASAMIDASDGATLVLHAYGAYDVASYLITDDLIPEVIAVCRSKAYHHMIADRVRFEEWLGRQQTTNVSVNELIQAANEAANEAQREKSGNFVFQRPVPGRV